MKINLKKSMNSYLKNKQFLFCSWKIRTDESSIEEIRNKLNDFQWDQSMNVYLNGSPKFVEKFSNCLQLISEDRYLESLLRRYPVNYYELDCNPSRMITINMLPCEIGFGEVSESECTYKIIRRILYRRLYNFRIIRSRNNKDRIDDLAVKYWRKLYTPRESTNE